MFASKVTATVTTPSGVAVVIRKLSWLQRHEVRKVMQRQSRKDIQELGGVEEFKKLFEEQKAPDADAPAVPVAADVPAAAPDLLLTHDQYTVLVCGVKSWEAPEPVTKLTLADLDDADAEFLAREILALSQPSPTLETDRKNDA